MGLWLLADPEVGGRSRGDGSWAAASPHLKHRPLGASEEPSRSSSSRICSRGSLWKRRGRTPWYPALEGGLFGAEAVGLLGGTRLLLLKTLDLKDRMR